MADLTARCDTLQRDNQDLAPARRKIAEAEHTIDALRRQLDEKARDMTTALDRSEREKQRAVEAGERQTEAARKVEEELRQARAARDRECDDLRRDLTQARGEVDAAKGQIQSLSAANEGLQQGMRLLREEAARIEEQQQQQQPERTREISMRDLPLDASARVNSDPANASTTRWFMSCVLIVCVCACWWVLVVPPFSFSSFS